MLPTENRLRRREDFATAVRRGRRAGRPLLVVHLRSGATDPHVTGENVPPPRAGFVVSKAVGGAVVRTAVKRRLRHLVRERLALLPPVAWLSYERCPDRATPTMNSWPKTWTPPCSGCWEGAR